MLNLWIILLTAIADHETMEEFLTQFLKLEEDRFLAGFHQEVQKEHEKA